MIQTLIGKKVEQTQGFLSDGTRIPVTVIAVPKTSVTQVKTVEKDGYSAVQIGIGIRKKPSKPLLGHAKSANLKVTPHVLHEVKTQEDSTTALGDTIMASDVFKSGDIVKVSGVGKGKGFQGGVKRHGFRGGPRTHGQSDRERAPGSIGQTTTPGRVYKGKRMAGHMGTGNVSVTNLVIVSVEDDALRVKGLIPGVMNSTVFIEKTGEMKSPLEMYESPEDKAVREDGEKGEQSQEVAPEAVEVAPEQETASDEPAVVAEPMNEAPTDGAEVVVEESPKESTDKKGEEK